MLVRYVLFIMLTALLYNSVRVNDVRALYMYLTSWGQQCNYWTLLLSIIISKNRGWTPTTAPNIYAVHHFFYTATMFFMPCITIIYWTINHKNHLQEIKVESAGDPLLERDRIRHAYLVHIIPPVTAWLQLITCDVVLIPRHVYNVAIGGVLYALTNFVSVKFLRDGEPLYWFLPWNDF